MSPRGITVALLVTGIAATLVACDLGGGSSASDGAVVLQGDGGHSPGTDAQMTPALEPVASYAEYCAAEARLQCSMLDTCCVAADVPFQRDVCEREVFHYASAPLAWCGLGLQPTTFDGDAAARCLSLRARLYPDCRFLRADDPVAVEAAHVCEAVATFTREPNATCDQAPCFAPPGMTSDCAVATDISGPFLCTPPTPRRPIGADCGGGSPSCDFGLYCNDYHKCVRPLPDGADCVQHYQCSSGKCTDRRASPFPTVCEPYRAVGWDECALFTDPRVSR